MKKILFLLSVLFFLSLQSNAQLRLPSLFSSNMVLQQNDSVQLWGWANPLEKIAITMSWNNRTDSAFTKNDAKWSIKIKTPAAGGPYTIKLTGYSTVLLENILIGEVWVCSGQSNMEWSFNSGVYDKQPELNLHTQNNIRFFQVPKSSSIYPQEDVRSQWTVCDSNTLKSFSAVGYFFAKKLHQQLNIPIGVINTSWGATPAEVWTPANIIESNPVLKSSALKQNPKPWCPVEPGVVYNAMIAPLVYYPIAGALWYQGESNTAAPTTYSQLLTTMADSWRSAWKKQLPFYFVQIAPFTYGNNYSAALVREQQSLAAKHAKMGMVITTDITDDTTDIHPKNKKDVGLRLANYALGDAYNITGVTYKSPEFEKKEVKKNKAYISFSNATDGLMMKGSVPTALYIAGTDKVFYPAEAKIVQGTPHGENNMLVVWSKMVKEPVAVRYEFSNTGIGNLFGKSGLPVAPFRTDDWEVK